MVKRGDADSDRSFAQLPLRPELRAGLSELGFDAMTLIQAQSLPAILAGRDVIARARTGSGKTLAFALGILQALDVSSFRIQALVLCPTRELADQVADALRQVARRIPNVKLLTLCGGVPIGPQIGSLRHSAHVIVGTPGRVLKHLRQKTVRFNGLATLVLDEADRMLDMGFSDELDAILAELPDKRQTLLFSATYPDAIATMSKQVQRAPQHIDVTAAEPPIAVRQYWLPTRAHSREADLVRALNTWGGDLNLVFCNTKIDCDAVARYLISKGISAMALHGDLEQADRTLALTRFSNHSATVLVATDVAARGLDIASLDAVFNYELPRQPEVYLHRIGRTGRAGREGNAVSLVAEREQTRLDALANLPGDVHAAEPLAAVDSSRINERLVAPMETVEVNGGRRNKLRATDILGAATAGGKVPGTSIGRIDVLDQVTFVAVALADARPLAKALNTRIKGKLFRARLARR